MKLPYFLARLFLNGQENRFRAQVRKQTVLTRQMLAKRMALKNTAFSAADIAGMFELMRECIREAIEEGYAVDTVLGMLKYSIQGAFESIEDSFDRSRHNVKAYVQIYSEFLQSVEKIQVEKVAATVTGPQISIVKDGIEEDAEANTLKAGGIVKIIGGNLKIIPNGSDTPTEGVYLIATDGTETKVEKFVDNNPSRLTIVLPASIAVGNYNLELRTYYSNGQTCKRLHKSSYEETIHIIAS